ncbi:aldo/keto reductase [candidate division KSB1 bacterium]|nr:aldo/keto reductase [candidate division KSB1 bacterium]
MNFRKLGWTDLSLSTIGFGAWALGGGDWQFSWGPQDDNDSINAILHAVENGINWIDTAAIYGLGHSEIVVAKALKQMTHKPFVATKCSRRWDKERIYGDLSSKGIREEIEASLKRLGVDAIDLYQIHWPNPDEMLEEAWHTMAELVAEGKIRYAGVSNFSVAQMERIRGIHPIASLQPPYSMLKRDVEHELLTYCATHNIGVIAYSPMQKGLLTGKFTHERIRKLPDDDHRRNDPMFQDPRFILILELVETLRPIAEKLDMTLAQLALAWVLRRPEITAAIVGARSSEQIVETARASDKRLDDASLKAIDNKLKQIHHQFAAL